MRPCQCDDCACDNYAEPESTMCYDCQNGDCEDPFDVRSSVIGLDIGGIAEPKGRVDLDDYDTDPKYSYDYD